MPDSFLFILWACDWSDILFPIYLGLSPYLLSLCNLSLYPDCDSRLIVKIFYEVYTTKGGAYMFICCKT